MVNMLELGTLIRRLREERKISQQDLAKAAKVTIATLNRLEHGKENVTIKTLQKILDVFGQEISFTKKSKKDS